MRNDLDVQIGKIVFRLGPMAERVKEGVYMATVTDAENIARTAMNYAPADEGADFEKAIRPISADGCLITAKATQGKA